MDEHYPQNTRAYADLQAVTGTDTVTQMVSSLSNVSGCLIGGNLRITSFFWIKQHPPRSAVLLIPLNLFQGVRYKFARLLRDINKIAQSIFGIFNRTGFCNPRQTLGYNGLWNQLWLYLSPMAVRLLRRFWKAVSKP
jgi:hypothetical protein